MKRCTILMRILGFFTSPILFVQADKEANILWILVDDMSPWMGCYGEKTIPTPNIDSLAEGGVRFSRTYASAPICSIFRSALITGTMQTTLGLHQHRTKLMKKLPEGILTVPELFRKAGYLTFNERKEDYNFSYKRDDLFSPEFVSPVWRKGHLPGLDLTWLEQLKGKKFFGQIQLVGGKLEGEAGSRYPAPSSIKESQVTVPPQYPDNSVFRNAIARHYEQISYTDQQVGAILDALKKYDLYENTAVFFFTDHGCQLPRAKQFVYDEGTHVPLLVKWPKGTEQITRKGSVRDEIISSIDISASSLAFAGIKIPSYMESQDLFADNYQGRKFVVSARDRADFTIDYIRAVRSKDFCYIRNFKVDRALFQTNYRDAHMTFINLNELHTNNALSPLQASYMDAKQRPAEELYDLKNDPNQLNNLANNPEYIAILEQHRKELADWQKSTDDKGQYPETNKELYETLKDWTTRCVNPEYEAVIKEFGPVLENNTIKKKNLKK